MPCPQNILYSTFRPKTGLRNCGGGGGGGGGGSFNIFEEREKK